MKRVLWLAAGLVVVLAGLMGAGSIMDRISDNRLRAQAEAMRDEVRVARAELEQCLDEMDELERAFRAQEEATETLRRRVDEFEGMDERGVPRDRYDEYLETVEHFNESLPEWERLGEEYREMAERCRTMAEAHNEQADSLGIFLVEEGLVDESWTPEVRQPPATDPGD